MSDPQAVTKEPETSSPSAAPVDVAIGIAGRNSAETVRAVVETAARALERRGPLRTTVLVAGMESANGAAVAPLGRPEWLSMEVAAPDQPSARPGRPVGEAAAGAPLRTLMESARRVGARAFLLVDPAGAGSAPESVDHLVEAILVHRLDYAAPYYRRQRFGGAVTKGIVYPLTRALYGKQVRHPFGAELACSAAMLERLLAAPAWSEEANVIGVELAVAVEALCANLRVGQAVIDSKPRSGADLGDDLSVVLRGVLGPLFGLVERRVPTWQKIRGSERVVLIGSPSPVEPDVAAFDATAMLDSFRLGLQSLQEIWGLVLPPTTVLALKRLARQPREARTSFGDALWARVVYDFALAYHTRVMSRDHLLAAITPLYLGWLGSFVLEMGDAPPGRIEQRIEQLCLQYEAEKPYLISRWRWPDRFNP